MSSDQTSSPVQLSVVIPARNSAPWLGEMLASLRAQAVPSLEIIVVDNSSTDDTRAVVELSRSDDVSLIVLSSGAASAAEARNAGVAAASGEYLTFADADDLVPDGAYRAMIEALEASGSDMVIGDHLKFSATRTWSPTRRWFPFGERQLAVRPREVPTLLANRPCWNRMFRRSFWDDAGLRFPEVQSVEDIEPMTRALVEAAAIDVVPDCVYLYRDRGDTSSLSLRADASVTVRYLEEERACAALVRHDPVLRAQHAEVVLDADGWAHLHRFLLTGPDAGELDAVSAAARALLRSIPLDGLGSVAPNRRALWELVLRDEWAAALSFVIGTSSEKASERLAAWVDAVVKVSQADVSAGSTLAADGMLPAFVNEAEDVEVGVISEQFTKTGKVALPETGQALADAMSTAIGSADANTVRRVSALRRMVPLVVDRVDSHREGLEVSGPANLDDVLPRAVMELTNQFAVATSVELLPTDGGWHAILPATGMNPSRYSVRVRFDGVHGSFPVVTARMPLPPVDEALPMQPLADRTDGWRFLVDRRPAARSGLGGLLSRVLRKVR